MGEGPRLTVEWMIAVDCHARAQRFVKSKKAGNLAGHLKIENANTNLNRESLTQVTSRPISHAEASALCVSNVFPDLFRTGSGRFVNRRIHTHCRHLRYGLKLRVVFRIFLQLYSQPFNLFVQVLKRPKLRNKAFCYKSSAEQF